jgi:hypothetical protein
MVERPSDPERKGFAPDIKLPGGAETGMPDARPTVTPDDTYDATWTERMLNSLVAWGRRERGLMRHAHSDAGSYVAYSARPQPIPATARGAVDRGTVEFEPSEDERRARLALRAAYAATTVVIHRKRVARRWLVLAACAIGGLGMIGTYRGRASTTSLRGNAGIVPTTTPVATTQPSTFVPVPSETVADPTIPATTTSVERPVVAAPPRRHAPPQPRPQARTAVVPPASSSHGETHRDFVDVVNHY